MLGRRARFGKRSRLAAVSALALFFVGQAVAGLLLDYRYPLTRFPSAAQVVDAASKEQRPPAFAFFGSSRTGAAVDIIRTNELLRTESGQSPPPRAVNMSVPAGDPISAEFILDQMLKAGVKPRYVVMEVSPETVNFHNMWMAGHVMRQLNWEHVYSHFETAKRGKALWHYLEARCVPVYTHRKQLVIEAKKMASGWLPKAGVAPPVGKPLDWDDIIRPPDRMPDEELLRYSRTRAEYSTRRWLTPYHADGITAHALERIIARCKAEGIGVVLLGVPACTAHRKEFTPAVEASYMGLINRLTNEHGCRFIDARDWMADSLFLDDLHLRFEDGAKVFTDRLVRDVLLELLQ